MRVVFTAAADEEFEAARRWYEGERAGLGTQLVDEAARLPAVIASHPLRFRVVRSTLRRALVQRFPYAIYYRVVGDLVLVEGFLHGSRDPRVWTVRDA
jgi:plasmid stabilization system protein ParE